MERTGARTTHTARRTLSRGRLDSDGIAFHMCKRRWGGKGGTGRLQVGPVRVSAAANDALVIGGGINGLVAASCLARSGLRVALFEARGAVGGLCEPASPVNPAGPRATLLYAFDDEVIRSLELAQHGLSYTIRDVPTFGLRPGAKHILLGRDSRAAAKFIRPHGAGDADVYPRFRRALLAQARALRRVWWEGTEQSKRLHSVQQMAISGASALLANWFDSDSLKAVLAFDATADGLSIDEPASALALLWRAAQENSGLQGAAGILRGGSGNLVEALVRSARIAGVEIRTGARAMRIAA